MSKIIILCVVGARPNFMKIAPIIKAFQKYPKKIQYHLIHTGQHYDEKMSQLFFDELRIPVPEINLEVGSGSQSFQTAEIMKRFEPIVLKYKPDYVLVVGDVNSTIACGLVTKKHDVKLIHVESGLRSFDREMPEEINRVLTDQISDVLFITEKSARNNLLREGINSKNIHFVGNVMIDSLLANRKRAEQMNTFQKYNLKSKNYFVLTLHRPSNVDQKENLKKILNIITLVSQYKQIIFPAHPRTYKNILKYKLIHRLPDHLKIVEPLGYLEFLNIMSNALGVLTDSGGIQEETTILKVPCITLRENTERPTTVESGYNVITGIHKEKILLAIRNIISRKSTKHYKTPPLWDGKASDRIAKKIIQISK